MYLAEELLAHILTLALFAHPETALPLLTASKQTHRIALPLLLTHVRLTTRKRSNQFVAWLSHPHSTSNGEVDLRKLLRKRIRTLSVDSLECAEALLELTSILSPSPSSSSSSSSSSCVSASSSSSREEEKKVVLDRLELCLTTRPLSGYGCHPALATTTSGETWRRDEIVFRSVVQNWPDARELVLSDGPSKLSHACAWGMNSVSRMMDLQRVLVDAIHRSPSLEFLDIQYRLLSHPVPIVSSISHPGLQEDTLAFALSRSPNLRIVRTLAPTLLNNFFTTLALSPSLHHIELIPSHGLPHLPLSPKSRPHLAFAALHPLENERTKPKPVRYNTFAPIRPNPIHIPNVDPTNSLLNHQLKAFPRLQELIRIGDAHLNALAAAAEAEAEARAIGGSGSEAKVNVEVERETGVEAKKKEEAEKEASSPKARVGFESEGEAARWSSSSSSSSLSSMKKRRMDANADNTGIGSVSDSERETKTEGLGRGTITSTLSNFASGCAITA